MRKVGIHLHDGITSLGQDNLKAAEIRRAQTQFAIPVKSVARNEIRLLGGTAFWATVRSVTLLIVRL